MGTGLFEQFRQEGRAEGRAEGQREALLLQLEAKFGTVTPEVKGQVERLSPDRIWELLMTILNAQSLKDLGLGG
jgi:hypothetical protein